MYQEIEKRAKQKGVNKADIVKKCIADYLDSSVKFLQTNKNKNPTDIIETQRAEILKLKTRLARFEGEQPESDKTKFSDFDGVLKKDEQNQDKPNQSESSKSIIDEHLKHFILDQTVNKLKQNFEFGDFSTWVKRSHLLHILQLSASDFEKLRKYLDTGEFALFIRGKFYLIQHKSKRECHTIYNYRFCSANVE